MAERGQLPTERRSRRRATDTPALTQLDPQETNVEPIFGGRSTHNRVQAYQTDVAWRHRADAAVRPAVLAALNADPRRAARAAAFRDCGRFAWIQVTTTMPRRYRVVADCCKDRFCAACARQRSDRLKDRLTAWASNQPTRMVTLTIRSDGRPLTERCDRLIAAFRRLRQRTWWKRHVTGGIAVLEVKRNPASQNWHPHLHIIARGHFLPHAELSAEWHHVTRDSYIIDVRLIRAARDAVRYITKYLAKPVQADLWQTPAVAEEVINALAGRRTIISFGDAPPPEPDDDQEEPTWLPLARLNDVLRDARNGDRAAWCLLAEIERKDPCTHPALGP